MASLELVRAVSQLHIHAFAAAAAASCSWPHEAELVKLAGFAVDHGGVLAKRRLHSASFLFKRRTGHHEIGRGTFFCFLLAFSREAHTQSKLMQRAQCQQEAGGLGSLRDNPLLHLPIRRRLGYRAIQTMEQSGLKKVHKTAWVCRGCKVARMSGRTRFEDVHRVDTHRQLCKISRSEGHASLS